MIKKFIGKQSQKGDTIVEVLLSMTILAFVLGAAYAATNRSLNSGITATNRAQALAAAQEQLETLKAVGANNPAKLDADYRDAGKFCISPTTTDRHDVDPALGVCGLPVDTPDPNGNYGVYIEYQTDSSQEGYKTFRVVAQWDDKNAKTNTSTLIYKPQNSFIPCAPTDACVPPPQETDSPDTDIASFYSIPGPSVPTGTSITVYWTTVNVYTCTGTASTTGVPSPTSYASWAGDKGPQTGSDSSGPFVINGDSTFTLSCYGGTGTVTRTLSVNIAAPPPTITFNPPSPASVSYKNSTNLTWSTTGATSCTSSWTGGSVPTQQTTPVSSGQLTTAGANTTLTLSCTGPGGTTNATRTVAVGPKGLQGYYYRGASFNTYWSTYLDPNIDFLSDPWVYQLRTRLGVPIANDVSAYWTGQILIETAGTWTFATASDDGVQLYIDGSIVLANWSTHGYTIDTGTRNLSVGWHTITVNWNNNQPSNPSDFDAYMRLFWASPSQSIASQIVVPPEWLRPY